GTKLLTNAGAADPLGAAQMARELARAAGLSPRIAAVTEDGVLGRIDRAAPAGEVGLPLGARGALVSARARLGAHALPPPQRGSPLAGRRGPAAGPAGRRGPGVRGPGGRPFPVLGPDPGTPGVGSGR